MEDISSIAGASPEESFDYEEVKPEYLKMKNKVPSTKAGVAL